MMTTQRSEDKPTRSKAKNRCEDELKRHGQIRKRFS